MKRKIFASLICLGFVLIWSCGHSGNKNKKTDTGNRVTQLDDGTFSLRLDKAACYSDVSNPSGNTAEWTIVISKPGSYKVWLSSATRDTTNLHYLNSVRISLLDKHLEAHPKCDKIISGTSDLPVAYFRADSYMGTVYIPEAGEYNIQVISEKVITKNVAQNSSLSDDTMLMSVILTP